MLSLNRFTRVGWLVPLAAWVMVLLLPLFGIEPFLQRQISLVAIYALVVAGLNLSFGFAGELALGQVAVMAAGAYTTAILGANGVTELAIVIPAAMGVAGAFGLITGLPSMRLNRWSLGLTSFFLVLLLPGVLVATREFSGGLEGMSVAQMSLFGWTVDSGDRLFTLCVVSAGIWMILFRNLVLSRYGSALRSLRQSPVLVESLGVPSRSLKLSAYVVGSVPAGLAGCLFALLSWYISPTPFNLSLVIAMIAAAVFAGATSIYGAVFGAALLVFGPLQAQEFEIYSTAIYGLFLLIVGALLSNGIAGLLGPVRRWITHRLGLLPEAPAVGRNSSSDAAVHVSGALLEAHGIAKSFGKVQALSSADLVARPGQVTAIIGSNGAGKTTLLNTISGFLKIDEGSVALNGTQLSGRSAPEIARHGVARAFQTPHIPEDMTVLDVVRGGFLREGSFHLFSSILRTPAHHRRKNREVEAAHRLLTYAGLGEHAAAEASSLPLGLRRMVEVVRAMAGSPSVILLDEPAAGLDDDALQDLGELIRNLRSSGATIVLIEHNVPFVMSLADEVWVMELGRTIAHGGPDEIRANPAVINSYLGRRAGADETHQMIAEA